MWRKEDVIQRLKEKQKHGNMSLRALAKSANCTAAYISDIYNGNRNPGEKILDYLDISTQEIDYKIKERKWK